MQNAFGLFRHHIFIFSYNVKCLRIVSAFSDHCGFQVPDENATYILEPVTNEEYYQVNGNKFLEERYIETNYYYQVTVTN